MSKHGKRYKEAVKDLDLKAKREVPDAVDILSKARYAKFDESIEMHIRLGVDPRNAEQQVRGTVVLPHGTGKEVRVLVFAKGDAAKEAEEAGASYVGAEDLAAKIKGGWTDFDAAVATPDMMRIVGQIGKILGPRGLMPNPKAGTVTPKVGNAVEQLKAGKVEYRLDRQAIVHCNIGKSSFENSQLSENALALLDALWRAKPAAAKGTYMKSISLTSTMGPGINVIYNGPAEA